MDNMSEEKQTDIISVIVPIYNIENYLEECLNSLVHQTYRKLQIILVDDGSTDRSGEICDKYAEKDSRITVIHKKNGGLSSARNCGMDTATGELITFVDGDDYIDCAAIQSCVTAMKEKQADVVEYGIMGRRCDSESSVGSYDKEAVLRRLLSSEYDYPSVAVWNKVYRASLIAKLRFPEGKIHEDTIFSCKVFCKMKKYYFINQEMYFYRSREDSITHQIFSIRDLDKLELYKERTRFLMSYGDVEAVEISIAEEFIVLFSLYWKAMKSKMKEAESLKQEIIRRKREFRTSKIPWKRKLVYVLFYFHPACYLAIRDFIEYGMKRGSM